jgi:ABC-2 type transport system ATP-binding protein
MVILDEPFSGLDPVNSQTMRDIVVEVARSGHTVLFSTHIMEHAEKMCDRIVIIARGQKVVDGTLAEVKQEGGKSHVALSFTRNAQAAREVLADRNLVQSVDDAGASAEVQLAAEGRRAVTPCAGGSGRGLARFSDRTLPAFHLHC